MRESDWELLSSEASLADPLPAEPFDVVARWIDEAKQDGRYPNPTAMALATADAAGRPACRIVLCRGVDPLRGELVFFTNRESRKGRALAERPQAAATFHWDGLGRQVRLEGTISLLSDDRSDAYFASRPRGAQIAAWASAQSEPIASREALLARLRETGERLGGAGSDPVPRPPFWGGYVLRAERVELWLAGSGRAHDRALWVREGEHWSATRLQP